MSFSDQLTQNVRQATVAALIATVIEDEDRSIGEILDSLERDEDAKFLTDTFKELTIAKLIEAAMNLREMKTVTEAVVQEIEEGEEEDIVDAEVVLHDDDEEDEEEGEDEEEDEDEDELEDEDLDEDDEFEEEEDGDENEEGKPRAPRKRVRTDGGGANGKLPLHDPDVKKDFQSSIVKFLRKNKDPEGTPASNIRAAVGGTPQQVRENLADLISADRVSITGQARGTRYHLN